MLHVGYVKEGLPVKVLEPWCDTDGNREVLSPAVVTRRSGEVILVLIRLGVSMAAFCGIAYRTRSDTLLPVKEELFR